MAYVGRRNTYGLPSCRLAEKTTKDLTDRKGLSFLCLWPAAPSTPSPQAVPRTVAVLRAWPRRGAPFGCEQRHRASLAGIRRACLCRRRRPRSRARPHAGLHLQRDRWPTMDSKGRPPAPAPNRRGVRLHAQPERGGGRQGRGLDLEPEEDGGHHVVGRTGGRNGAAGAIVACSTARREEAAGSKYSRRETSRSWRSTAPLDGDHRQDRGASHSHTPRSARRCAACAWPRPDSRARRSRSPWDTSGDRTAPIA